MMLDSTTIKMIKSKYRKGMRICIDNMKDDPHPIESGTKGTIDHVDDIGTIHCIFDNRRMLGVIPFVDEFHLVDD